MLAHSTIGPRTTGAGPTRWMLFLHGILGNRANLRSAARRFVERRPGWGALLADLRMHGDSQDPHPPHTVRSAAGDLDELAQSLDGPVAGVLGHSFGGKVALAWAAGAPRAADRARAPGPLEEVWLIDSMPGARPDGRGSEDTVRVVEMLRSLPPSFGSREDFVAEVERRGFGRGLATWLAMNLERRAGGTYGQRLDLDAIRALLEDYLALDLWDALSPPPEDLQVHLVIGGKSGVFTEADRERGRAAARASERVHLHVLEGAGHWVHIDAPEALLDLVAPSPPHENRPPK